MYVSMEALQGWEMGGASLSVCHQHLPCTVAVSTLEALLCRYGVGHCRAG